MPLNRIAVTTAPFDAITATLPVCSVAFEPDTGHEGERHIWLTPELVNKLRYLRGPAKAFPRRGMQRHRARRAQ